jgi:hypothetical protein
MKARLFLMLALWAVFGCAHAAKPARRAQARPVVSMQFAGFTLKQPPTLIPCPIDRNGVFDGRSWSPSLDSTCMEAPTRASSGANGRANILPVHFSHSEEPLLASGVHLRAFALLILDGTVQGVIVRIDGGSSQNAVYAMLRNKYGVPTTLSKRRAPNADGKASEMISASWRFSDLRIRFEGSAETTREAALSVTTAAASDYASNVQDASSTSGQAAQ